MPEASERPELASGPEPATAAAAEERPTDEQPRAEQPTDEPGDDEAGDAPAEEAEAADRSLPDSGPDSPLPDSAAEATGAEAARRRRFTPVSAVVALLLALLGFTLVVQLRAVATDPSLAAARQEDLVRILSDLDSREERLRDEIADLEDTQRQLTTAGESQEAALAEATRRADELGILAGTLPVEGPGITVRMSAGAERISAATLLDAVQELRGAGAEAIEIASDGRVVRVVASTYFVDTDGGILIDGETLPGPYTLTVIGEPSTLAPALNIPGGVVESVQSSGGTVIVQDEPGVVQVSAVRAPTTLQHAHPVS